VIVGNDSMAQQAQRPRQAIAEDRRADMTDMHRFGDVGRAEVNHHGARLRGFLKEEMIATRRRLDGGGQYPRQKTSHPPPPFQILDSPRRSTLDLGRPQIRQVLDCTSPLALWNQASSGVLQRQSQPHGSWAW
jgi:hypothetical protein